MDELTWKPAWQLRDLMASGELSPVEVAEHFLARIEKLDPSCAPSRTSMRFRGVLAGHDLLLSPTSQLTARRSSRTRPGITSPAASGRGSRSLARWPARTAHRSR